MAFVNGEWLVGLKWTRGLMVFVLSVLLFAGVGGTSAIFQWLGEYSYSIRDSSRKVRGLAILCGCVATMGRDLNSRCSVRCGRIWVLSARGADPPFPKSRPDKRGDELVKRPFCVVGMEFVERKKAEGECKLLWR